VGRTILVLTTGAYVVAEYDERTGNVTWQRVVHPNQKLVIQRWLDLHFPPKKDSPIGTTVKVVAGLVRDSKVKAAEPLKARAATQKS
jgi:hypothetical protein